MCGCMLMHAAMNHEEHQSAPQSRSAPIAATQTSDFKCLHCGFTLQKGYAFCPGCGMTLRTAECSACGQKVEPNWNACAYCGSPLGETREQPAHL